MTNTALENIELASLPATRDTHSSGAAWGAAIAGAFVGAALSLILLSLGAGFGLSVISPWSNASATTADAAGIVWLVLTEALAAAMGGYLAGRLRTRWISIHTDEVHFRDTANGLLSWAIGLVMTVAFLTSSALSMSGGAAIPTALQDTNAYYVDRLLHSPQPGDAVTHVEAARVFAHALLPKQSSPDDVAYLGQLVASRSGLSRDAAEAQVSNTIAEARQNEEAARKAIAHLLLWVFVALLTGAFCASFAATIGGRQRDHVRVV